MIFALKSTKTHKISSPTTATWHKDTPTRLCGLFAFRFTPSRALRRKISHHYDSYVPLCELMQCKRMDKQVKSVRLFV